MHGSVRLLVPAVLLLLAAPGCSRKYFRERADADVTGVVTQKNIFPEWSVRNWFVYPHPQSRFAHPFNPDRPPYPADDYAARILSPNPQHPTKKTGTGRYDGDGYLQLLAQWDAENRAQDPARGAPPGTGYNRPYLTPKPAPRVGVVPSVTPGSSSAAEAKPGPGDWQPARAPATVVETHDPAVTPAAAAVRSDAGTVQPVSAAKPPPPDQPPSALPPGAPEKLPAPQPVGKQPTDPKAAGQPPADPKAPGTPLAETLPGGADDYLRALATNELGYRIKMDQAMALGLINSREFQDRREDLYLAALPVTLERFSFAAQAFFTEQVVRNFAGSQLAGGRLWQLNTTGGFNKQFAAGGQLLVQLANQVVINLGQGRPDIAFSNLSLSFLQPLFRGGGFAVTLENLTGAERNLLYGMRSYARFRKLFYVSIVAGGGITNNPYGLQGLAVNLGRGIGGNLTAPVVGFLPLLQASAIIANQRKNVAFLEGLLRLYQAFREGGQQSDLQVGQVEVQLLGSRVQLLGSGIGGATGTATSGIRGYLDQLDNFKLQLGLPVTVGLDLDNTPLKPIRDQLGRFEDIYADLGRTEAAARQYNPNDPPEQFRPRWRRLLTESDLVKGTAFSKGIAARWDEWAKLTEPAFAARLAELNKQRLALLEARAKRQAAGQPEPEAEVRKLAALDSELDLAAFERAMRNYDARPWLKIEGPVRAIAQAAAFRDVFNAFYQLVLEARNERLDDTRTKWPKLPSLPVGGVDVLATDLDEAYTAGIQAALSSRLDLMNARGQVVDAYRQIAVQANSLQGVLNVGYDINAGTPGTSAQPFAFSGERTRQTLTFRGELPLVRRAERNNYRAALIGYQRQRRTLMAFEDNIANDVRGDIRQLRTLAEQYRIQQRVVELGYSQVDNAQALLIAPPAPGAASDAGSAAALTQQVLNNQGNLLQAQNTLYQLWVSYLTARMQLYLDLELMQIDERGVWCDEQTTGPDSPPRSGPDGGPPAERIPAPTPVGPADRK